MRFTKTGELKFEKCKEATDSLKDGGLKVLAGVVDQSTSLSSTAGVPPVTRAMIVYGEAEGTLEINGLILVMVGGSEKKSICKE